MILKSKSLWSVIFHGFLFLQEKYSPCKIMYNVFLGLRLGPSPPPPPYCLFSLTLPYASAIELYQVPLNGARCFTLKCFSRCYALCLECLSHLTHLQSLYSFFNFSSLVECPLIPTLVFLPPLALLQYPVLWLCVSLLL